jgi:hypothetical protein
LVAHFGACKGVLDAISVALNELYTLGLAARNQDMGKGRFWNVLLSQQPTVAQRYTPFRLRAQEIIDWRDAAVHRVAPFFHRIYSPDSTEELEMLLERDPDPCEVMYSMESRQWVHPLHFHDLWHDDLLTLCVEACKDIASKV